VVNDCDFDAQVVGQQAAGYPLAEEGEVGDFFDDGLGDAAPRVSNDGGVSEFESESDLGGYAVVKAGDDDHVGSRNAEWHGSKCAGELLVSLEQRGHGGCCHSCLSFLDSADCPQGCCRAIWLELAGQVDCLRRSATIVG
jgi:hypothetical protein